MNTMPYIPESPASTRKRKTVTSYCVAVILPAVMLATYMWTRPFADVISTQTVFLGHLSMPQRTNIELAAQYLNGTTIRPGETFSFNKVVGPRIKNRGYRAAPSYVGSDTTQTIGGGICLLSSSLYQMALESGLNVTGRTPHLRTIKSVKPGLDATVWYGRADLTFQNNTAAPMQIHTSSDGTDLKLELLGTASDTEPASLSTFETFQGRDTLRVRVVRNQHGHEQLISDDLYGRSK